MGQFVVVVVVVVVVSSILSSSNNKDIVDSNSIATDQDELVLNPIMPDYSIESEKKIQIQLNQFFLDLRNMFFETYRFPPTPFYIISDSNVYTI